MVLNGENNSVSGVIYLFYLKKGLIVLTLGNVRLTKTEKQYKNAGWHVTYCFEIDDIITKFESSAHLENNLEKYKDKDHLLKSIKEGKIFIYEKEQL